METQITFPELQEKFTLGILKQCVELAEGFEFIDYTCDDNIDIEIHTPYPTTIITSKNELLKNSVIFSTLLHRAVEGWNKQELINGNYISFGTYAYTLAWGGGLKRGVKPFDFKNYQPCHLTACEMAIIDCLCEVLR